MGETPLLSVEHLSAWYGQAQALREVSVSVAPGEVVTLVGRNGAGKTTLLRSIMGLHRHTAGRVLWDGQDISRRSADQRARRGIGWVPDDRGIYASLSVAENLTLPPRVGQGAWSLEQVYEQFPVLRQRQDFPGTKLSGGEQQMLAIARVLRMGARLLLLDEPSEGLAPVIVHRIGEIVRDVAAQGVSVLLVEQDVTFAAAVADRAPQPSPAEPSAMAPPPSRLRRLSPPELRASESGAIVHTAVVLLVVAGELPGLRLKGAGRPVTEGEGDGDVGARLHRPGQAHQHDVVPARREGVGSVGLDHKTAVLLLHYAVCHLVQFHGRRNGSGGGCDLDVLTTGVLQRGEHRGHARVGGLRPLIGDDNGVGGRGGAIRVPVRGATGEH